LGQWFTPEAVADLALALAIRRPAARACVLDPACGDGVFLGRAHRAGVPPASLFGVEIDAAAVAAAVRRVPGAVIARGNFFDYPLVFSGYDAVIGNPPYVRQERLADVDKQKIRNCLLADLSELLRGQADLTEIKGEIERLCGRGDLAVAFIVRSLCALRPGGRLSLVVSSALLDAGYARPLWRLVQRLGRVIALVEAPHERWFPDAAVNAVILLVERGRFVAQPPVTMARLQIATARAAQKVGCLEDLARVAELRQARGDRPELWARTLRSPPAWFQFERAAIESATLVPLAQLAKVRRGVTSGANRVFYLERERAAELALERAVLAPLVRSPREAGAETIAIDPSATSHVALVCPAGRAELARYPRAAAYLRGQAAVATLPTLRARASWWALPVRPARLFLTKAYAARFVQRFALAPVVADQRVYSLHPRPGVAVELLAAVLNSTFTALALESLGRASLGEGALEWTVSDAQGLPVVDPRRLPSATAARAVGALRAMSQRRIGTVWQEAAERDRGQLDRAVAKAAGAGDLAEIHEALIAAVRRRIDRAASASR
jgi:SAM-dependent methyltransferase